MRYQEPRIWLPTLLLMIGVLVMANTNVLAADIVRNCDDSIPGTCLEIFNTGEKEIGPVYIVKAVAPDPNGDGYVDAVPGSNWPYLDEITNNAVFTYWAGVSEDYLADGSTISKPSAWSYIVFDLGSEPLDAEPPGAQLNLDALPVCADTDNADANRIYYKLNPSVNFKGDAIFHLIAPPGTQVDPCNNGRAYVLFGKECSGGLLAVPHVGTLPFVQQRRFWCSEKVYIHVEYDQCTGIPYDKILYVNESDPGNPISNANVAYNGYETSSGDPISPHVYADMPGFPDPDQNSNTYNMQYRDFQVTNWGPAYGTLLCTDSDPVFVWKDRAYFCVP